MGRPHVPLPDYGKPPVVEVVFGVQFNMLSKLTGPHIGMLWERLGRDAYPGYQDMAPLPEVTENYRNPTELRLPTVQQLSRAPLPRSFLISKSGNSLIQVQQNRFLRNWRKQHTDDTYPRYAELLPEFMKSWGAFAEFITEERLGEINENQYELTYVNQVPEGEGWNGLSEIGTVFSDFQVRVNAPFLPEPESIGWRRTYVMPEQRGRLYANLEQAYDTSQKRRVLVFTLTARGFDEKGMQGWFDSAREWIVRGFDDLTGEGIQKSVWERQSD